VFEKIFISLIVAGAVYYLYRKLRDAASADSPSCGCGCDSCGTGQIHCGSNGSELKK
jgi:hypothetical protein